MDFFEKGCVGLIIKAACEPKNSKFAVTFA